MPRTFIFAAPEPAEPSGEPSQITEAEVCGSGFALQMEAVIGEQLSIGMPAEEIWRHLLALGLSEDQLRPLFAIFGLAA